MSFLLCSFHRLITLFCCYWIFVYLRSMSHSLALISSHHFTWLYHPNEITSELKAGITSFHLYMLTLFLDWLIEVQSCVWAQRGGDLLMLLQFSLRGTFRPYGSAANAGGFSKVLWNVNRTLGKLCKKNNTQISLEYFGVHSSSSFFQKYEKNLIK